MTTLTPRSQALLTEFGSRTGVTPDQIANLQSTIDGSPALAAQINAAVAAGHLQHFALLPAGTHAGGSYDGSQRTMNLPPSIMSTPAGGTFRPAELTFVLGHEIQHGFNHAATTAAYADFQRDAERVARSPGLAHDYTAAVGTLIAANRRDEAGAEITGWNATVSAVRTAHPAATLRDVYLSHPARMADFIDVAAGPPAAYSIKPDLTLNADLTMASTPANIEGMGRHYFDHPPAQSRLGHNGNSDYANFYGAYAVGVASDMERAYAQPVDGVAPTMMLNMAQLRLSESLMEQNGIRLSGPGHPPAPQAYSVTSTTPPTPHHFDHTVATHAYTPVVPPAQPTASGPSTASAEGDAGSAFDPRNRNHPDHALYRQIRDGVQRIDDAGGRAPDAASERLAASLLPLAKANGITRVDHVVLGRQGADAKASDNVFLVQGELNDPAQLRAHMKTETATRNPVADSFRQAEAISATRQQQPEPKPVQTQERAPPPEQIQAETQKPQVLAR